MAEHVEHIEEIHTRTPGWVAPIMALLAIVAIAGLGLAWYDASQLQAMQNSVNGQFKTNQQSTSQEIAAVQQKLTQSDAATAGLTSDLGVVTKRLRVTQSELTKARKEAVETAQQIREDDAQKLAELNTTVNTQLATKASTDDLNTTNGTVTTVKTDLEGTKTDLKMARSEMGTLIARNHDEIDQLRRLGEREYSEFTISTKNKMQKVGSMNVELRGVDTKKNQYSVVLVVDDLRTEKKNRSVNEPIFFFARGDRRAGEFVVNSVGKDKISGYVSLPKAASGTAVAAGN